MYINQNQLMLCGGSFFVMLVPNTRASGAHRAEYAKSRLGRKMSTAPIPIITFNDIIKGIKYENMYPIR